MQKFNLWKFCLAMGIICGVSTLLLGWFASATWGETYVTVISSVYKGFGTGFQGGIIGGIWGFFYGAVFGLAFAWVYNALVAKKPAKRKTTKRRKR